jgi:hypothetical protein
MRSCAAGGRAWDECERESRAVAAMFGTPAAVRNRMVRERGSHALRAWFVPLTEPP